MVVVQQFSGVPSVLTVVEGITVGVISEEAHKVRSTVAVQKTLPV